MKTILLLFINTLYVGNLGSQNMDNIVSEMDFFNSIEGIWEGTPKDTSFVSVLDYQKENKDHFAFVDNDTKTFAYYAVY